MLDQLGLPRDSLLKIEWQLGTELLCTAQLRGIQWSAQGDWAGGTATLVKAMREAAATAMDAEPDQMRLWLRYRPASTLADANSSSGDGSASSAQPPAAPGAVGPVLVHDGVAGIMDMGVLWRAARAADTRAGAPMSCWEIHSQPTAVVSCTRCGSAGNPVCSRHVWVTQEVRCCGVVL